jgi:lipoate-protein ligase A
MAVDEAILCSAIERDDPLPTLRWYRWSTPTLSLGYFQSAQEIPASLAGLDVVRRLTGGGAIVHDREWTYSLVFPSGQWPRGEFIDLVVDVHSALAEVLSGLARATERKPTAEPFLCFERRSAQDLVAGETKIVGSAQRKRAGVLLQHGSILTSASDHARHLSGAREVGVPLDEVAFCRSVESILAHRWGWVWEESGLSPLERSTAEHFAREKYGSDTWTRRR